MTIQIAKRLAQALNVRSGSRIKTIDDCLRAYGRSVAQGPTVPMTGSIDATQVVSGTFPDARIAASNVTQHQAALALAASQTTSGTFADARISQSSVTQHEAALNIDWLQLTGVPSSFTPSAHNHVATEITSGTLNDARLSSNVPLKNTANAFSQLQTFNHEPSDSLTGAALLSAAIPILGIRETGAGSNEKVWDFLAFAAQLRFRTATDAGGGNVNWLTVDRTGTTVDEIALIATGINLTGRVGFNGTAHIAKPAVTGSRGGNAALASLLTALANYGLVTDSSTA